MENIESFDTFVNEAKDLSKKEVKDLKVKINNARTIGKYFTKDEVEFLTSLFESDINEAKRLSFKDAGITNTMDLNNAMNTLRDSGIDWDQKGQAFVFVSSKDHASAIKALGVDESDINEANDEDKPYFDFLLALRDSGATNMFGATPYLQDEFGLSKSEARKVLAKWMKSF